MDLSSTAAQQQSEAGGEAATGDVSVMANNLLHLYSSRLSVDNTVRKDAEARITQLQNENPNGTAVAILMILRQNSDDDARQQAGLHLKILLKESSLAHLISGGATSGATELGSGAGGVNAATAAVGANGVNKSFWDNLSQATRDAVKSELLATLESEEPSKAVRNAVCDTTAILASRLLSDNAWPELQPKIFTLLSSPIHRCQVSGLQVLSSLVTDLSEVIGKSIGSVQEVLSRLMPSESPDVRYECINLISAIVESEKRPVWKNLQGCIPSILQTLSLAVQDTNDSEQATKVLIALIDIAEYDAGFFSIHLSDVTKALFTIALNAQLDNRIRQLSLELVLTMVEGKPKMCKKAPGFIDELLKVLMEFLVTIEDDPEWVNKDKEDDDDDEDDDEETSNYEMAEGGLDRLAASAGGDVVLPKLFTLVVHYLQQPQWTMKYAAMIAVSQTVEHIPEEEVEKYLDQIVPMCLAQLEDPHPRVRFAACQAIGQAATDTQPLIQEQYISTIMPALIRTLDDPILRIQSHSARALTNFCEEVTATDLAQYTDSLVEKLLQRVTLATPKPLLSSCVTTLAVVAAAADKLFVKYYPTVVPAMKEIVRNFSERADRSCREKALECITLVALAIGAEAFANDTAECMQVIIQMWTTEADLQQTTPDGRLTGEGPSETLNESLCRMCRVLSSYFVQYLPHIMPRLFKVLDQKPHQTDLEELAGDQEVCLVGLENGKTIGMKTQTILEMEQMTTLLYTFVATLGEHFKEWIALTVQSTLPLLEFQYCEKIMQNALHILAEALKVARKFADVETSEAQKTNYMQMLAQWMWKGVEKSVAAIEDDQMLIDNTMEIPKSAASLLKNSGPNLLTADQVYNLSKKTLELLDASCTRNEDIVGGRQEEHDEDDEDEIEGEERYELELAVSLVEILSAIIEHHSELFCQIAAPLAEEFIRSKLMLAASPHHSASGGGLPLTLAVHVICEFVAMGDKAADKWVQFIPALIEALSSSDPVVRQPAAHGLKLIAKTTSVMPAETVVTSTRALVAALEKSDRMKQPLEESDQGAADNVVAAIGAMVFQQSGHLLAAADASIAPMHLLNVWLAHLPLKADDQEGQLVHSDLVNLVLVNNEQVMGQNMCNMPHLLKIFSQIYKTAHSTEETNANLIRIAQSIGESAVRGMNLQLDKDQQKNLERLFFDAREQQGAATPTSPVAA